MILPSWDEEPIGGDCASRIIDLTMVADTVDEQNDELQMDANSLLETEQYVGDTRNSKDGVKGEICSPPNQTDDASRTYKDRA